MLDLNPETICHIIRRAAQFHATEEVVIPEEPTGPGDASALAVLADHRDDDTYAELKAEIADLEPDQQVTLVALMWLGRGDFDVEEWESALAQARDQWTANTADYLIATPLVADYLDEGLALLGYSCSS
jgi:hypothetical protein